MKKVARLLAVGGVSAMTALTVAMLPGSAMAESGCDDGYTQVAGSPVYVHAGSGGLTDNPADTSAGACAYSTALSDQGVGFTGGTVEAGTGAGGVIWGAGGPGVSPNPGGHPTCGWGGTDPQCVMNALAQGIPGVYVVAQGQDGNTIGTGQLEGYIGVSTLEENNSADGGSTNSGGEIAIDGVGVYNIPSPLVCGNTSGNNWDSTTRQGCEIP